MTSRERVRAVMGGERPDRVPLYDKLRNDAVVEHFAGAKLTLDPEKDLPTVREATRRMVDSAPMNFRTPGAEREERTDDGRRILWRRWTSWTQERRFTGPAEYEEYLKETVAKRRESLDEEILQAGERLRRDVEEFGEDLCVFGKIVGDPFYALYRVTGIEHFSYCLADVPDALDRYFVAMNEMNLEVIRRVELPEHLRCVQIANDIASKKGLIFSPAVLERYFFRFYRQWSEVIHARGLKLLFHSDGDNDEALGPLIDAGTDAIHPWEKTVNLDLAGVHRRYPQLVFVGTVDAHHTLPLGTPDEVRAEVRRNVELTEGRILIGASTEIGNDIPLENALAMAEAARECTFQFQG